MTPQTFLALLLALRAALPGEPVRRGQDAPPPGEGVRAFPVRYEAENRAVTNWRLEAAEALEPKPVALLASLLSLERPFVTRCVKLNNYWCIKSARWDGEIATDKDGHVGFASADQGANAAVALLRRYYLQFRRKSALDIVRRWAPPECGVATSIGGLASLAVNGIGNTLRARYLASHRIGQVTQTSAVAKISGASLPTPPARPARPAPPRVSVVPLAHLPEYHVPDIAEGMGEHRRLPPQQPRSLRQARAQPQARPVAQTPPPLPTPRPKPPVKVAEAVPTCAPDEQRLRNYANAIVEGLGIGPTDDLKLFADDGTPLPNLSPVMLAMSGFELGLLRASSDLVDRAIQHVARKAEAEAKTRTAQD
ncbi:hypothetical protein [Microvirga terricola]|uniref:Uncharacterized protein n=1 Tax=Microvirga terricola TaxID=2719797 RepID=A0ABX0VDX6_9HYPH|nr:hypothetical protein [Microvirga terricola]NIX76531.1 hypothetical protein [Microvirga terricola]